MRMRSLVMLLVGFALVGVACADGTGEEGAAETDAESEGERAEDEEAEPGSEDEFVVGMTLPTAQNVTIQAVAEGLGAEVEQAGGELVTVDNQLDIDKQIADIDQLITQDVDALVVWPLDPSALSGVLARADEEGIRIFAHDAVLDEDAVDEDLEPIVAQVLTGRAQQAVEAVDYIREQVGDDADVVGITIGPPVPTHRYLFEQFEAAVDGVDGMELIDKQGNPSDDAAGARPLMENMLTRFAEIDAVYTYNDPSAIGASTAAEAAGRRDEMLILGYNAGPDGVESVESGTIDATWDYKPVEIGQTLGRLATLTVTGEVDVEDVAGTYTMDTALFDADNIGEFIPWDERVEQVRSGDYLGLPVQ